MFDSFDIFEHLLVGKEIEYDGKTYLRLATIKGGLITAVEKDAKMPAPVVVIEESEATKPNKGRELNHESEV